MCPGIPGNACLADPQAGAFLCRAQHAKDEAGCSGPVAISCLRNLMHAMDAQPVREGVWLRRGSCDRPDQALWLSGS
jgi:hypothetical protein